MTSHLSQEYFWYKVELITVSMTASFARFTSSNHHPASNKLDSCYEVFVVISWLFFPPLNTALCMMTKHLYLILMNPNNIIPQLLLFVQNL